MPVKMSVREEIQRVESKLPRSLRTDDLLLNGRIEGQLGIQMVLITADGYTLLRKRGKSVLEYPDAWDVSFSGYCGQNAVSRSKKGQLDVGYTVRYELDNEIKGAVRANPREITFTALHVNSVTGTTVLTGYWRIEEDRNDLAKYLNKRYPKGATVFETTEFPKEVYVYDNKNMLVDSSGPVIAQALTQAEQSLGNEQFTMVPAGRVALLLALHSLGQSTKDLVTL
jgi:hypothetical protein